LRETILPRIDRFNPPSSQFLGFLATLTTLFLLGGSSRDDVQSLAILNPVMILCCGLALLTLKPKHLLDNKLLFSAFALVFLLNAIYLLPLPISLESTSPGAGNAATIRAAANVHEAFPVLAITPAAARQSLFFLFAPLAVFLFSIQLKRDDFLLTLPVMIFVGAISGAIGMLQIVSSSDGPLYFYRITNHGSAVGLFANRNHAAVLLACLFPMLAVFAAGSHATRRGGTSTPQLVSMAVAFIVIPLVLVTGSRSGILTLILGIIGSLLLYVFRSPKHRELKSDKSIVIILAVSVVISLVLATIYFSRAEAIERIFVETNTGNDRAEFWSSSMKLLWQYFPLGFGPGSFVSAFQNDEPMALLNGAYLNRLHNDWLETILTYGVPGILLLLSGMVYYVKRLFTLWFSLNGNRSSVAIGRMASIIIAMMAIASVFDYPLRTPAMMGFFALVIVWFAHARRESSTNVDTLGKSIGHRGI
jgi:hypothetical protein